MTGFPKPDHDHRACAADVLKRADRLCRSRGARLTDSRAKVLDVLARGHQPVGAYEIVDALAEGGQRPAPVTVYRALDFLVSQGLAHRIESRNAFVACMTGTQEHGTAAFLICRRCGVVAEVAADELSQPVARVCERHRFEAESSVIEIEGLCGNCRDA
ncbi:Fur family transcriptional regulator [Lutibaculum baratangense]|uniref:Ferric uptake regulation protein n=1 Tax=Lutibaculum baratangense AMV1 TaxID=631454 RepID=V4RCZ7_9HYPH|nr:Fur family transcriptional regulator [Lutibaculum baratangense]ESR24021.1 Zinc uptake regulation protein ZUR [Lutibaculum baratangense AMV1]